MDNTNKIRNVSTALYYSCLVLIAIWIVWVGALLVNVWYRPDALGDYINALWIPTLLSMGEADLIRAIPAAILITIPDLLYVYALWRLSKVFQSFRKGIYFTEETANHLFIFSVILFFYHLFSKLVFALADVFLAHDLPASHYLWPLHLYGDGPTKFVFFIAIMTISWVLREAIKIAKENAEFV
ncbi:MAG: DUF2975 domain-containing protein [Pseudomonadales bacterium]|nr:DUF2975 domain-containing protein [Pseudomonadales bacterium]